MGTTRTIDLLVIVPDLRPGGVTTHSEHLVRAALYEGMRPRLLTVAGDDTSGLRRSFDPSVLVKATDLREGEVLGLLAEAEVVVVQAAPATLPFLSLLGLSGSAVLAVHGSPGANLPWWGRPQADLLHAMQGLAPLPVVVPGAAYCVGVAAELDVDVAQVHVALNAVERPADRRTSTDASSVTVAMRLAEDKAWVLGGGIALARAGDVPLRLVGEGPYASELTAQLAACGLPYEVVQTSDLAPELARASVVAAVGLVALEAAASGRRVAVVSKPAAGQFAGVVQPDSWRRLQAGNFAGVGGEAMSAETAWRQAAALDIEALTAVKELVARTASPEACLKAVLGAAGPVPFPAPDRVREGLVRTTSANFLERAQLGGWITQLQADLRRAQAEHTATVVQLVEQRERLAASERQRDEAARSLATLASEGDDRERAAAATQRQLDGLLASTAWRLSAPLRAVAGARHRRGQRSDTTAP